ncbi:formyltetrahydrofolate deformylase [Candidatus Haliotispira prima]|uniref:Formyltetrahydrofolate deformylase n=1 Tax=Candidatus Haliotispira prima TaxID=3034016 RepID=A0ABY8MM30_9SPIO|nr:formyltetrahydrofolate deformylase [Candidatus Haliotispira prima]
MRDLSSFGTKDSKDSKDNPCSDSFTLLMSCPDQKGVVAGVAAFIHKHGGNIYSANQHFDKDAQQFFARFAWTMYPEDREFRDTESGDKELGDTAFGDNGSGESGNVAEWCLQRLRQDFAELAQHFSMNWQMDISGRKLRSAIFVSRYDHCLYDLLVHRDELNCDFRCIISNHRKLEAVAKHFGLRFYYTDFSGLGKAAAEKQQLEILLRERIELMVLARYMQILSPEFLEQSPAPAINIHHSFLPAFKGAKPYHQAYERGVKIIGATSHYVTADLDQGPIIAQDVQAVSHRDSVEDLVRKGRSIEKYVLLQAVRAHTEQRVLCFGNRTVVFPG